MKERDGRRSQQNSKSAPEYSSSSIAHATYFIGTSLMSLMRSWMFRSDLVRGRWEKETRISSGWRQEVGRPPPSTAPTCVKLLQQTRKFEYGKWLENGMHGRERTCLCALGGWESTGRQKRGRGWTGFGGVEVVERRRRRQRASFREFSNSQLRPFSARLQVCF